MYENCFVFHAKYIISILQNLVLYYLPTQELNPGQNTKLHNGLA